MADNPFAAPDTRLAESAEVETGWSSFTHWRRVAIAVNATIAIMTAIIVLVRVAQHGFPRDPVTMWGQGLYPVACALNCLVLWPWRRLESVTTLAALINLGFLALMTHFVVRDMVDLYQRLHGLPFRLVLSPTLAMLPSATALYAMVLSVIRLRRG